MPPLRARKELIVAIWSAITFGALLASIMISQPVRDALALDGDVDDIPWLWTGTFAVFLVVAPIWGKAVTREPRQLVPRAFHLFAGCSLMPGRMLRALTARPSRLYETVWRPEVERGRAEFIPYEEMFVDCGTPANYLAANLHQSGGQTVVGARAVVRGTAERCVVWPDSLVGPDEHLVEVIRAGPITVDPAGTR